MVVYSTKALATAALVIGFSSSAFGCLVITGKTYNPNTFGDGTITTTDNGVQTCNGEIGVGDKNVGMFYASWAACLSFIFPSYIGLVY